MIWEDLNENLIVPDLEAKSSDEVFEKLGGLFIAEGYCRDTYLPEDSILWQLADICEKLKDGTETKAALTLQLLVTNLHLVV